MLKFATPEELAYVRERETDPRSVLEGELRVLLLRECRLLRQETPPPEREITAVQTEIRRVALALARMGGERQRRVIFDFPRDLEENVVDEAAGD